jgi:two-component system sensor histidine kinase RegB
MDISIPGSVEESGGWSGRRLKLSTLIRLRWLAVSGQTAAIMVVALWFGFPLPMGACLALISLSAWLNLGLRLVFPPAYRLDPNWAALLLAYDLLQLVALLYLTGGLENPFAILLLGPVMVSATAQPADKTFLLGAMTLGAATVLVFVHRPLPWFPKEQFEVPLHYVGGVWVALVCALFFMAFYAFRVAEEARQLANALAATELVLQREQHISALDGLAAAAAHELGTPLATIALVAHELASELEPNDPRGEDIRLIRPQSERCRYIPSKIASLRPRRRSTSAAAAVASPGGRDRSAPRFGIASGSSRAARLSRWRGGQPALWSWQSRRAVDFAKTEVQIAGMGPERVQISIVDDGPGFSPDVIDRLGGPMSPPTAPAPPARMTRPMSSTGLGLGIFIAKTLLERSGGRLKLANRRPPETGARVTLEWKRLQFDAVSLQALANSTGEMRKSLIGEV